MKKLPTRTGLCRSSWVVLSLATVITLSGCLDPGDLPAVAPPPTEKVAEQLQARAFQSACLQVGCAGFPIYAPLDTPASLRSTTAEIFTDEVEYIALTTAEERTGDNGQFENNATMFDKGEVHRTGRADVVGVDISIEQGFGNVSIRTFLFLWDGTGWVDSSPDETGVTVTTSVS